MPPYGGEYFENPWPVMSSIPRIGSPGPSGHRVRVPTRASLAVDPTHDFLTLAVTGFALFLSPWVAGLAGDYAAWTAWVSGVLTTAIGVVNYLRGERLDFATNVRDDAAERYRKRFR